VSENDTHFIIVLVYNVIMYIFFILCRFADCKE